VNKYGIINVWEVGKGKEDAHFAYGIGELVGELGPRW
jgi:hypothetical protein